MIHLPNLAAHIRALAAAGDRAQLERLAADLLTDLDAATERRRLASIDVVRAQAVADQAAADVRAHDIALTIVRDALRSDLSPGDDTCDPTSNDDRCDAPGDSTSAASATCPSSGASDTRS